MCREREREIKGIRYKHMCVYIYIYIYKVILYIAPPGSEAVRLRLELYYS